MLLKIYYRLLNTFRVFCLGPGGLPSAAFGGGLRGGGAGGADGLNRGVVAEKYIHGSGIEIGALHKPLAVPNDAVVAYVDRMSPEDLKGHYPELGDVDFKTDIIDDGERLSTIIDGSQDFVIANHFIEHCEDPIGALTNMLRVLRVEGVLYLAVPDMRFTFDSKRPITTFEHLLRDHNEGPEVSRKTHYCEWMRYIHHVENQEEALGEAARLMEESYSIHFHVWSSEAFLEFLQAMRAEFALPFQIAVFMQNGDEMIAVLRKG